MTLMHRIIGLVLLFGAMASVVSMLYFFVVMHAGIRPERTVLAQFLGPLLLVAPGLLTEEGERARTRLLISIALFVVLFGGLMFIEPR